MKQATTILLAILILLQPLGRAWIVVSFKINQKEIAATLCVQKEVANNACQGQCLLKKKLAQADEQEQKQTPVSQKEKIETLSLFCYKHTSFGFLNGVDLRKKTSFHIYNSDFCPTSFLTDIFHPPKLHLI